MSIKYLVTSDVHLGHENTPTTHIIQSFKTHILSDKHKDIDILFISGDLFDRLLDLNSKEVYFIIEFFNYLLSYCTVNNIRLRVLEGTPSHDWGQSQILVKLNDIRTNKCDLKYHKVLDIEYIEELNHHILYIPDEWTNSHDESRIPLCAGKRLQGRGAVARWRPADPRGRRGACADPGDGGTQGHGETNTLIHHKIRRIAIS